MYVKWQFIDVQKHPELTELTSEAAYSEGEVAALLYRDVPEKQFQRTLKCSIRKHLLICTS